MREWSGLAVPLLAALLAAGGCRDGRPPAPANGAEPTPVTGADTRRRGDAPPSTTAAPAAGPAAAAAPCPRAGRVEAAPGLVVERIPLRETPTIAAGDRCLTLVRIDPARYRLRLLTAHADGGARPAPRWVRDEGLTGAINSSMYRPDLHSIGLLASGKTVDNGRDNRQLGGFLAFDPVDPSAPPVAFHGRSCPGFDLADLRRRYRSIVQNYRMLDCDGEPLAWADAKVYSAAGVGLDREGRVVFFHVRTPYAMTALNRMLADPALGLRAAHYVEGGPEASLYVAAGDTVVAEMGSFETAFHDDSNAVFWPIPNVIGFAPR